jgi:hypothetical protein
MNETYYLHFDASGNITGVGMTPDGTLPTGVIECTQAQYQNPSAWRVDTAATPAEVVPASAAALLAQAQAAQSAALSAACAAAIISGFQSSALGTAHTYPSQPNDQSNLIGATTRSQAPGLPSTWTCNFWCADSTGAWALRPHTAAQIQQVLADAVSAREAFSSKLAGLVAQVQAATTIAAVQSVAF